MAPTVTAQTYSADKITLTFSEDLLADALPALSAWGLAGDAAGRTVTAQAFVGTDGIELTCSGGSLTGTPLLSYTNPAQVAPPVAPGDNYSIPGGATSVTDGATLQTQLSTSPAKDIVLEDGTYDKASAFTMGAAHRLYARNALLAVLTAGIEAGNNSTRNGQRFSGLKFNVTDTAKDSVNGACLGFWGQCSNWIVEDCEFQSGTATARALAYGIFATAVTGATVRRVKAHNFTDVAVRLSDNSKTSTQTIATVEDIEAYTVYRDTPGIADGTAESGLWTGHPITTLRRVKLYDTGWMGWTPCNAFNDTVMYDLDVPEIDQSTAKIAVYAERNCDNIAIERAQLGVGGVIEVGVNGEWDSNVDGNGALNGFVLRHARVVCDSTSAAKTRGVYADDGCRDIGCHDVVFEGMKWSCAGWNNDTSGATSAADFHHNDYSGRVTNCARVSSAQLNSFANGSVPDIATETTLPRRLLAAV